MFSFAKGIFRTFKTTKLFIGQALAKVHQSTDRFELNRMTYDTQNLLINPVLKTKEYYNKNVTEIEFLEKLSSF